MENGHLPDAHAHRAFPGLMLVTGFLPALTALFIAPIAIGILVYNSIVAPACLDGGIVVALFNSCLGDVYWEE